MLTHKPFILNIQQEAIWGSKMTISTYRKNRFILLYNFFFGKSENSNQKWGRRKLNDKPKRESKHSTKGPQLMK